MAIPPPKVYGTKLLSNQDLDELALAALAARKENVEKSQVSKLLEYLNLGAVDEFTLMVYLVRQAARGAWSRSSRSRGGSPSASRLFKVLRNLTQRFSDEGTRRDAVREALGYFKWFYESWDLDPQKRVLSRLSKKYDKVIGNPSAQAPRDFVKECLEALLGL